MNDRFGEDISSSTLELQEILRIFIESELLELKVEFKNLKFSVSKSPAASTTEELPSVTPITDTHATLERDIESEITESRRPSRDNQEAIFTETSAEQPVASAQVDSDLLELRSPSGGFFHRRPAPSAAPFVSIGDAVKEGDPLCVIEVMKMFTEVVAPIHGTVVFVFVENGKLVEQGDILMTIRRSVVTT